MLEELTIPKLTEMCVRENVSVAYKHKSDLVDRLHQHYDEMCTATPEKEFFYVHAQGVERSTNSKGQIEKRTLPGVHGELTSRCSFTD